MKYKGGPWHTLQPYDGEHLRKIILKNGGSVVQYFPGNDFVVELWISEEEEDLPHSVLLEMARAVLVLQS